MRGGADHAVVQRQAQTVLGREVSVDDLGIGGICLAEAGKEGMSETMI